MSKAGDYRKDAHGQPLFLAHHVIASNASKAIDQLSGICAGILADGVVNEAEAKFFGEWLEKFASYEPVWPLTAILERVDSIFRDGIISDDEREELKVIMMQICGAKGVESPHINLSTALPIERLDYPLNSLKGKNVNITGRFAYGTRLKVLGALKALGAIPSDRPPDKSSDYLIIGHFASRDWFYTNYGRKIERAVELRSDGAPIRILGEEDIKHLLK